jgi:hypothetical protein
MRHSDVIEKGFDHTGGSLLLKPYFRVLVDIMADVDETVDMFPYY